MSPETVARTQQYLFASPAEMEQARLPAPVRDRLLRLRETYVWWLENPRMTDAQVVAEIRRRTGLGVSAAYDDLRLVKVCLGNLHQATADYYRYLFLQRCEESFQMAREKEDPRAFAATLAALGKYTRLDAPEGNLPDYAQIVPQQFEISPDPADAGYKPIPGVREKVKKLLREWGAGGGIGNRE